MPGHSLETFLARSSTTAWNWQRVVKLTGQFALGVVLLWWIVEWLSIDGRRIVQIFAAASFVHLSWAVICFALSLLLKPLQYFLLLPVPISRKYMFGVVLSQHALLTLLPWRLGEMSLPVLLRQDQKISLANSVSSVITIRSVDFLIVIIVAMAGIRKLGFEIDVTRVAVGIGAVVILAFVVGFAARRLRGQTLLRTVTIAVRQIANPLRFVNLVLLSAAGFLLSTLQSLFVLRAFGLAISITDVALLNAVTLLAALLPVHPPGGWGTMDSIQIVILHYLNYQPELSAPVILAAHCFYTLLVLFGGSVGWIIRVRSIRP
jgi:uncharacterized membrane protein YbhN (UPF0104 family)